MEFIKGSKLEVLKDFDGSGIDFKTGDILTVLKINDTESLSVECSRNIGGHDCSGLGKRGDCWNIYLEDIPKVKDSVEILYTESKSKPTKRLNQSEFIGKLSNII